MTRSIYLSNLVYNTFERYSLQDVGYEDYNFKSIFERESFAVLNLLRVLGTYSTVCRDSKYDIHKPDFCNDIVVRHITEISKALSICCHIFQIRSNLIFENSYKTHKTDVLFLTNTLLFKSEVNKERRITIISNILKGVIGALVPIISDRLDIIKIYIEDKKSKILELEGFPEDFTSDEDTLWSAG